MHVGPQSGKFGIVHNFNLPITHMFNWTLDSITHTPETYYASNTRWAPDRNPGVIDWAGSFQLFDASYIVFPGEFLACLELFTAPESGVYGTPGATYCGQAIVESTTLTWAWGAEQSLTQTINFAGNGCVIDRQRTLDDLTVASPSKMCGRLLEYQNETGEPANWTIYPNVQTATLTFTSNNPAYVNSSTGCCTHRRPGNINWTLALNLTDHRAKIEDRDDVFSWRLWYDTNKYWELIYSIFSGVTNVIADRQTGAIQSQTANYMMKALLEGTSTGLISVVTDSSDPPNNRVNIWPPTASTDPNTENVPNVPGQPSGSETSPNIVSLTWAAPQSGPAPTSYIIWASEDGVDFSVVGCTDGSTSYADVGVPNRNGLPTNWYYKITAGNAWGQGDFSQMSTAIVVDGA